MPSFGRTLEGLQKVNAELDGVVRRGGQVHATLGSVREAAGAMSSTFDDFDARSEKTKERQEKLRDSLDQSKAKFDVLSDIQRRAAETENVFTEKFNLGIEAVKIGAQNLDDFISTWGDAILQTEDGGKRIRDLFSGIDFGKYEGEIRDFVQKIYKGGTDIGEVIAFIDERAGNLAKGLVNVLRLFQQGKASLEDVQRALDAAKDAFPGGDADALADAIRDGLLGGLL